jgi:hypothetical protein
MSEPNAPGAPPPQGGWPPPGQATPAWVAPGEAGPAPGGTNPAPSGWGPAPSTWSAVPVAWSAAPTPPAHLQPGLLSRLDPRGWRTTILVLVLLVAGLAGSNLLNGVVPLPAGASDNGTAGGTSTGPVAPGSPLQVGSGVQIYGPNGWSVVKSEAGTVALGKGSGVIVVLARPFSGTLAQLEAAYRDAEVGASGSVASDPKQVTFGKGIPGMAVVYSTTSPNAGPIDGAYFVGLVNGTAVIVDVLAPQGTLSRYSDDADVVLSSVSVKGDGQ